MTNEAGRPRNSPEYSMFSWNWEGNAARRGLGRFSGWLAKSGANVDGEQANNAALLPSSDV